ncbi:MAG: glycosyl transferase family 2 [Solirubrobacterales bacterium]|nr:glycosyl transferase family 2 [Solirubrobacterales bacterium]
MTAPAASVVMVTRGGLDLALHALRTLREHTPEPVQTIVVDNASPDVDRLDTVGIELVRNAENRGFGPACNQGAELARAAAVVFLNPDALVHRGWLAPLLAALIEPGVVAAAPRLLNPDGTLQEAGALVFRGAITGGYGEGDDPDALPYRFRRTVEYASAACLLVDRAEFAAVGGFDPAYAPAYYEDSDLCFRLGGRIVYEPRSTVTHVRYGSGDLAQAERLSARNRATFLARHGAELADRPGRPTARAALAVRDARAHPRLLVAAPRLDHVHARLATALCALWPEGRTTLHVEAEPGPELDALLAAGVEVATGPRARWLASRRLHYDAVFAPEPDERLASELDATQPGASRVHEAPADLRRALPAAGLFA